MKNILIERSKENLVTLGRIAAAKEAIEIHLEHQSRAINELAIIVLDMNVAVERLLANAD